MGGRLIGKNVRWSISALIRFPVDRCTFAFLLRQAQDERVPPWAKHFPFTLSSSKGERHGREWIVINKKPYKGVTDTLPFGTRQEVYATGYEWLNYSLSPAPILQEEPRIRIGGPACSQPYAASLFNISAMSFGALSKNAIRALNGGAKRGGFAHNTGEGGLSPYHLEPGGDLIWQIGTGYFGCRTKDGHFDPVAFQNKARLSQVKMIEIKLSQGAKPGHGGVLPGAKVSQDLRSAW